MILLIASKFIECFGKDIKRFADPECISSSRMEMYWKDLGPDQLGIVNIKRHSVLFLILYCSFAIVCVMKGVLYTGFTSAL